MMRKNLNEELDPILDWREGDEITLQHRHALANWVSRSFNLNQEREAETRAKYERLPDEAIAKGMAAIIAARTGMHTETFEKAFPTLSQAETLTTTVVRDQMKKAAEKRKKRANDDLGEIG
ncbi:MAG TPA: hypothetical protein VMZ30_11545 [Pyrinomonadaceae bacterium]|nr:hypothetical protein [Pyrinomonadaceae bacterium]